jgi:hypothetical protein
MVAHLTVIATCLSHNFAPSEERCTNAGESKNVTITGVTSQRVDEAFGVI